MDQIPGSSKGFRFLSFVNEKEDAEKRAKLKEAAARIEQAIAKDKSLNELIDYKPTEESIDLANDTRSLYERLQEQKNKKKEALEESQKLSNLVTTLDEEDVSYLNEVARNKREEELKKRLEIHDALEEQKRLNEKKILDHEKKLKESLTFSKKSIHKTNMLKKLKVSSIKMKPKQVKPEKERQEEDDVDDKDKTVDIESAVCPVSDAKDVMKCIGILPSLPIVEKFQDSSDSDNSDDNHSPRIVPRVGGRRK